MRKKSDGKTKDLDPSATTMWFEHKRICPNDKTHNLTGSTRRIYCNACGLWWWR